MRITFLSWRDTTHVDGGGSEIFTEQVAAELVRRGHEVTIRCAAVPGQPASQVRDGVRLSRAGGRLTVYPRALAWLLRNRRSIDVVVDVINGLPFASPLVRRRGIVALIHHVHREQWHIIYPGLGGTIGWFVESRITPLLYRGLPHLTVSDATARDLVRLGVPERRITVARNGVAHGAATDTALVPKAPVPTLAVLSRLVPHKQIEHLFQIAARLRGEFGDLRVDVIGEGWWHEELSAEADRLGVGDLVRFHGHVPDEDRDRLLASAWLHVLPSVKEGWGLAISEAALQGTPTLAYRSAGGVNESVVDGVTGALCDDVDDLYETARTLLRDPARRSSLGEQARAHAATLTWSATADTVEEALARASRR